MTEKRIKINKIFFLWVILIIPFLGYAQLTKIAGTVKDAETGEPLAYVNVYFKGTNIGATTDFNGKYAIEANTNSDTLVASYMGYTMQSKPVRLRQYQTIDFEMNSNSFRMSEVVILPGRNPAEIILENVIANKKENNWENLEALQFEVYNKIQLDINNFNDKFKRRRAFRQFEFIFEHVDTSVMNGKPYLPVFLTESISDFYYLRDPRTEKEHIRAVNMSGVENQSLSQYLGQMYLDVNVYDNYMTIFDKHFVSPIADNALRFYKFYLVDTSFIGSDYCFNIMFKPRRKQELTFTGNMWIHDTTYAIRKTEVRIAEDANLNYVNDMIASQEFSRVEDLYWVKTKETVLIDFNLLEETENATGFFGHKTTSYNRFVVNQPKSNEFYNTPVNIEIDDGALKKDEEFWNNARHDSLGQDEVAIYNMVDSVKKLPIFKTYYDIVEMVITGYYETKRFELGPYASMYSFNEMEGNRFRFGGRTNNKVSKIIKVHGHVAYGTKDEKFKYGGGFKFMVSKNPRRAIEFDYKYDIEQLGQSQYGYREDFFLNSIFRRNPIDKLTMVEEYNIRYDHEWFSGFSTEFGLVHRNISPFGSNKYIYCCGADRESISKVISTELQVNTRLAFREKYYMGEFERTSLGTNYPVLQLNYGRGVTDFWDGNYNYDRLSFSIRHWFNIAHYGWSKYIVETGRIWGQVPYPLLKLHEGNETYSFDEYAFNLMNYYEFASDQYLSVYYTHHFDGFFLNHVPLMRKLKWREVVFGHALIGSLSDDNKYFITFPDNMNELSKPYFEAGVGIENILKFIRVDGIWRLSYLDNPDINKFNLMFSLQFRL